MRITFNREADDMRLLATFLAQLCKEDVVYTVQQDAFTVEITVTGY